MGRVETVVTLSGVWGRVCFSVSCGFDSGRLFLAPRLNRLGEGKLVEPACERQRVGRVETMVTWVEYVVRLPVVSTRVARSSRPGSTSLWEWKLVEPILTSVSEWVVSKPG